MNDSNNTLLYSYAVWDRSVRIFHWINVICVIGLISIGLIILYNKSFGVSADGKVLLKTIHVYFGYVFVINLLWRLIWSFIGNQYSRWAAILPFGKGYKSAFSEYTQGLNNNAAPPYAGHNPLARLMVTALFVLLFTQSITGLVLAGTDLYFPPFGGNIAEWVAADNIKPENLKPGSKSDVDIEAYDEMRAFRKPFITVHEYAFYVLCILIVLHISGVVYSEIKEKNGLISALFSGNKVFKDKPVDSVDDK